MQQIIDNMDNNNQLFTFIESVYETDEQLTNIVHNEKCNSQLFNLGQGLVFRCHLVYYRKISSNDLLIDKDVIIFNFHHALFDFSSMDVFLHDLDQAYTTGQLTNDDATLRYLDCKCGYFFSIGIVSLFVLYSDAVIEHEMPMSGASMFWFDALHDCDLDRSLPLPHDQYRLVDQHRTGRGRSISFDFDQDLSYQFLLCASSNDISLQFLTLACYYAFLFKLTNGEKDLCIGIDIDNRYNDALKSVIGMFVNTIPLRCQLDPHWSFHQLVEHVQEMMKKSLEYSYFPLQCILAQHPNISKAAFLDTSFVFHSSENQNIDNEVMIGDSRLQPMPMSIKISEDKRMSKFDFALTIQYNHSTNELSCTIDASLDLFGASTVDKIAQRFHSILHQLFRLTTVDQMEKAICELSLTSADEKLLVQSMNNTEVLFPPVSCIHHEFAYQVMKHPQKLAVELDDQSLTYSELLHCAQVLSLNLLDIHRVALGEIICQYVKRSLSMVRCSRKYILLLI
jgi:hypothetical protein